MEKKRAEYNRVFLLSSMALSPLQDGLRLGRDGNSLPWNWCWRCEGSTALPGEYRWRSGTAAQECPRSPGWTAGCSSPTAAEWNMVEHPLKTLAEHVMSQVSKRVSEGRLPVWKYRNTTITTSVVLRVSSCFLPRTSAPWTSHWVRRNKSPTYKCQY